MKLTIGDREWRADLGDLHYPSIGEAREIKRRTGMTIADWRMGLALLNLREDPDALAALLYLFRRRAEETVTWDEIDAVNSRQVLEGLELEQVDRDLIAATAPPDGGAPDAPAEASGETAADSTTA